MWQKEGYGNRGMAPILESGRGTEIGVRCRFWRQGVRKTGGTARRKRKNWVLGVRKRAPQAKILRFRGTKIRVQTDFEDLGVQGVGYKCAAGENFEI